MKNEKFERSVNGTVAGLALLGLAILGLISPAPAKADDDKKSGKEDSHYEESGTNDLHPQRYRVSLEMKKGVACIKSTCHPGDKYYIEATTSLDNPKWERICADEVSKDGKAEYDDVCAPDHTARFYRMVWTGKKSADDGEYDGDTDKNKGKGQEKNDDKDKGN